MQRAVVLAANADGYRAALDLLANDVAVAVVWIAPDGRRAPSPGPPARPGRRRGAHRQPHRRRRRRRRRAVRRRPHRQPRRRWQTGGRPARDRLRRHPDEHRLAPAANLLYQAGTRMRFDTAVEQFVPDVLPDGVFACGRVNGVFGLERKLADGARASSHAAAAAGFGSATGEALPPEAECPSHPWPIVDHPAGKNFVDFDEDPIQGFLQCGAGGLRQHRVARASPPTAWAPARASTPT